MSAEGEDAAVREELELVEGKLREISDVGLDRDVCVTVRLKGFAVSTSQYVVNI